MDYKRARELLDGWYAEVNAAVVDPPHAPSMTAGEERYLRALQSRMYVRPAHAGLHWPTLLDALEELAKGPEGWPVGTVVQAKGITPGRSNRWIVAAGPLQARTGEHADELYGEEVLLVDEEVARALDAGMSRLENAKLGGMLVDAYPREAFEVLEARCFDG